MNNLDWNPLWLTFKLSMVTSLLLFCITLPFAYWLSKSQWRYKVVIETLMGMPLILPPTVIGFYLLIVLSPNSSIGGMLYEYFGIRLVFNFAGLVLASMVYSLPFMVQPIYAGLAAVPQSLIEASYTMGKSRWETFFHVELPYIKAAMLTGLTLTFAHTIGEFGVVLMIGGNLAGETRVASIAIFDEVETMNYDMANTYAMILFISAFVLLLVINLLQKRIPKN